MSVCLSVGHQVYFSVCLFVCKSLCLAIGLYVCLSLSWSSSIFFFLFLFVCLDFLPKNKIEKFMPSQHNLKFCQLAFF